MLKNGFRLELEALIRKDISYVMEEYVSTRLKESWRFAGCSVLSRATILCVGAGDILVASIRQRIGSSSYQSWQRIASSVTCAQKM